MPDYFGWIRYEKDEVYYTIKVQVPANTDHDAIDKFKKALEGFQLPKNTQVKFGRFSGYGSATREAVDPIWVPNLGFVQERV